MNFDLSEEQQLVVQAARGGVGTVTRLALILDSHGEDVAIL